MILLKNKYSKFNEGMLDGFLQAAEWVCGQRWFLSLNLQHDKTARRKTPTVTPELDDFCLHTSIMFVCFKKCLSLANVKKQDEQHKCQSLMALSGANDKYVTWLGGDEQSKLLKRSGERLILNLEQHRPYFCQRWASGDSHCAELPVSSRRTRRASYNK